MLSKKINFLLVVLLISSDQLHKKMITVGQNYAGPLGMSLGFDGVLMAIFLLAVLGFFVYKSRSFLPGVWLILAGGISNLIDRWYFGFVRESFNFFGLQNNLADWFIFIGSIWIITDIIRSSVKKER